MLLCLVFKATFMVDLLLLLLLASNFSEEKIKLQRGKMSDNSHTTSKWQIQDPELCISYLHILSFFSPLPARAPWMSWAPGDAQGRGDPGSVRSISHSARAVSLRLILWISDLKKNFFKWPAMKRVWKTPSLGLPHFLKTFVIFFIS